MAQSKNPVRLPPPSRSGSHRRRLAEHLVVLVGAGPVGLSLAIDLAQRGQPVVLLDDADRIGEGSRAICFSKRTLEYWDRLGVGSRMVDKGVVWSVGRIFHGASLVYQFNLLPEEGHKRPAFINPSNSMPRPIWWTGCRSCPRVDLRWCNKVIGLEPRNDHAVITIETPDGSYRMRANYVVACDGARSSLRQMVGAEIQRTVFEDQFLIADVKMTAGISNRALVLVRPAVSRREIGAIAQAAGRHLADRSAAPSGCRILRWRSGRKMCVRGSRRMLGHEKFDFEWISLYKFQCRRMDNSSTAA